MNDLIAEYVAGPQKLRAAVAGMKEDQFDLRPVPGKWSTREVICHIADCEIVYADRMKRVIAEDDPPMANLDPDQFARRLAYVRRDVEEELRLVEATRRHVARILQAVEPHCFERTGRHSSDGPLTLRTLLQRIAGHIPHHIRFIEEKRAAMR